MSQKPNFYVSSFGMVFYVGTIQVASFCCYLVLQILTMYTLQNRHNIKLYLFSSVKLKFLFIFFHIPSSLHCNNFVFLYATLVQTSVFLSHFFNFHSLEAYFQVHLLLSICDVIVSQKLYNGE